MITLRIAPVDVSKRILSNVLVRSNSLNTTYNIQQSSLEQEILLEDSDDWEIVQGLESIELLSNSIKSVKTNKLKENQEYSISFNIAEDQ